MTAASLIDAALDLISDQPGWTQGVMARDRRQNEVKPHDEAATRFSLDGALFRCADLSTKAGQGDYHQAIQYLTGMFKGSLADFNDRSSHRKVIEYARRAARALRSEERAAA